jgi:hypothetical protein
MRSSQWRVRIKASQSAGEHSATARYNGESIAFSWGHATRAEAVAAVRKKLAEIHKATEKYKETTHA